MKIPESFKKLHPLDNMELQEFCNLNKILLNGIFSRNEKKPKPKKGWYIWNLDSVKSSGTHWTCSYLSPVACVYFDPFGLAPPQEVLKFIKSYKSQKYIYSSSQLQDTKSVLCGYYVAYVMYKMSKGKKIFDFLYNDIFSLDNTKSNDEKIMKEFKIKK